MNGGSTPLPSFDEDHDAVGALAIYSSMISASSPNKNVDSPSNMSPLPLLQGGNDTTPPRPADALTQVALVADAYEDTKQQSTTSAVTSTKSSSGSSNDPYFVLQSLAEVFEINHFRYVLRLKEQAKNEKVSVNLSALSTVKEFRHHPKVCIYFALDLIGHASR